MRGASQSAGRHLCRGSLVGVDCEGEQKLGSDGRQVRGDVAAVEQVALEAELVACGGTVARASGRRSTRAASARPPCDGAQVCSGAGESVAPSKARTMPAAKASRGLTLTLTLTPHAPWQVPAAWQSGGAHTSTSPVTSSPSALVAVAPGSQGTRGTGVWPGRHARYTWPSGTCVFVFAAGAAQGATLSRLAASCTRAAPACPA